MDSRKVLNAANTALTGSQPFPEIVKMLLAEGVKYYHVDYVSKSFTFYGGNGEVGHAPLQFEGLPEVAPGFDIQELRAAILDSQRNNQNFRDFCRRAMLAGVQGYFAFLLGNLLPGNRLPKPGRRS